MGLMGAPRGRALSKVRPRILKTGDKMGLPRDAYYVLTKAEASLPNSKTHSNSGAPNYNIVHNTSDLTGDTDDLDEGAANLYFTNARVETISDTLYLRLDASNSPVTGNLVINGTLGANATTVTSLNASAGLIQTTGDVQVGNDLLFPNVNSIINFGSGDITETYTANTLTYSGMTLYDLGSSALTTTGAVGIGTSANANVPLSVVGATIPGGYVQIRMAHSIADNVNKAVGFSSISYDLDEPDIALLFGSATATTSSLEWGGGNVFLNAATSQNFYTAANSTTLAGTKRLEIGPSGNFDFKSGNLSIGGNVVFGGEGSGLCFGSCSAYHANWTQVAAQNTWYNVSDADFIDGQLNNVTHDGSGKLTVAKAGKYLVNVSSDVESNAGNKHIEIGFEVSGSGSAETEGIVCREIPGANAETPMSTTAILDLAANATIELCIRTTDAGNPTILVDCVNMNCMQIGGT